MSGLLATTLVDRLTVAAAKLVDAVIPGTDNACMGTCAILARVLADLGIQTDAVHGTYVAEDDYAHWWLETTDLRIDPTRWQFDPDAPLVEPLTGEAPYVREQVIPSRWDHEQAVVEFARMFVYRDVGLAHGRRLLTELSTVAREG